MKQILTPSELRYLQLLSAQFPTVQAAGTEILRLNSILNLPKGTEHFVSDIHGEHEAFLHILNSCSGEVRDKLDELFGTVLSKSELSSLATLIYYPSAKLSMEADSNENLADWESITLHRLVEFCRYVSTKHTRAKVRKSTPPRYRDIIDELLNTHTEDSFKREHFENIINTIIETQQADEIIEDLCTLIKMMVVDHLHIVGDIFDRGPRADIVMDSLMNSHDVDIQWGNHDILWMGAASGSRTLVATVLANSIRYNILDVIETGYGISLRPLSVFASETYSGSDLTCFNIKDEECSDKDRLLAAAMYKAITVILLKLEGQKIMRRPEFDMAERLLLDKIDYAAKTVTVGGKIYPMRDCDFPTVNPQNPYELTPDESHVIDLLTESFRHSQKLQTHVRFLYSKGGLYKVYNGNLLFHGCIPMTEDGEFTAFTVGGKSLSGKRFLDYAEKTARKAHYDRRGTPERQFGLDFLWWLWCGKNSPIFGRERMSTFERLFIEDSRTHTEPKNPYYSHYNSPEICDKILAEFGLCGRHCHIINGHVPVKVIEGESPIKGGGKLLVIDGGFSRAYQSTSGIAGYTLVFNSRCLRIVSHQPFAGKRAALLQNQDITSDSILFESLDTRMRVAQTDEGVELQARVDDLLKLLDAYRSGAVAENHGKK